MASAAASPFHLTRQAQNKAVLRLTEPFDPLRQLFKSHLMITRHPTVIQSYFLSTSQCSDPVLRHKLTGFRPLLERQATHRITGYIGP
jgi:hypothetical protein